MKRVFNNDEFHRGARSVRVEVLKRCRGDEVEESRPTPTLLTATVWLRRASGAMALDTPVIPVNTNGVRYTFTSLFMPGRPCIGKAWLSLYDTSPRQTRLQMFNKAD